MHVRAWRESQLRRRGAGVQLRIVIIGFENANSNPKRFVRIRLGFEGFGIRYIRFTPNFDVSPLQCHFYSVIFAAAVILVRQNSV